MSPGARPDGPGDAPRASSPGERADAVPGDHPVARPAADAVPGDHPVVQPVTDPAASVTDPTASARAETRLRLQALAGATVHGSDGMTVGRVRDVYLHDATGELAAITVMPRQLSARSVLIPASAIAALPEVPEDAEAPGATTRTEGQTGEGQTDEAWTEEAWRGGVQDPDAPTAEDPDPGAVRAAADDTSEHAAAGDAPEHDGDHILRLLVDTATAKAGARPPLTLHTTPQDLQEAAAALHLEEGSARA